MRSTITIALIALSIAAGILRADVALAAPTVDSFTAYVVSSTRIDLEWTSADAVDHYNLFNTSTGPLLNGSSDTSYSDAGLSELSYYSYELVACSDADENDCASFYVDAEETPDSKIITSFAFDALSVSGTINNNPDVYTIDLIVPYGTNVTNLTPTIAVSVDATVSPLSGLSQDFSIPKIYTVTSADATTRDYTVSVTVNPPSVNIGNASAVANGTNTVSVNLSGMNDFGVILFDVSYDHTVVNIASASLGFSGYGGDLTPNINNNTGQATFLIMTTSIPGPNSPLSLLNITLQSVGNKAQTSALDLSIITLADATNGASVIPETNNGLFTILNSAPVMTSITITPNPAYKSTATLTANPSTTDVDSDAIAFSYQWKKGGVDITGETGSTLANSNFVKGDVITVAVIPNDGTADGTSMTSAGLTISNSAPTQPTVTIYPSPAYDSDDLVCNNSGSIDIDSADVITYSYIWKKNSVVQGALNTNTVAAALTMQGEEWECTAIPNDSMDNGLGGLSSTTILDNTAPIISENTPVSSPAKDNTPNYTFTSDEAGSITYGGDCSSATTSAISGANTVTFNNLSDGAHSNCTITVTDSASNASNVLSVTAFTVDTTSPTASITYSDPDSIVKSGDSLTITAAFSEAMADSPVMKIEISGSNTVTAVNMAKTDATHYTYIHAVGAGDGTSTIALSVGTDIAGNVIASAPTNGATFTVDNTAPAAVTLATSSPTTSAITLTWTAPGDDASTGTATSYDVRYSTSAITDGNWTSATHVTGEPTPSIVGTSESKTVSGLSSSTTYYFALKTTDDAGNISILSNIPTGTTSSSGGGGGGGGGSPTSSVTNISILINAGAATTGNATVNLTIGAANASKMAISNSSDFATGTWETYATAKSWNLTTGDGTKTVYIKFQDASGYYSAAASDSIVLSATAVPASSSYPNGTLLKAPSGEKVYLVIDGQKKWIETAADFVASGYKWEDIKMASSAEIEAIPNYGSNGNTDLPPAPNPAPTGGKYPDGTLIKISDSFRVYVILNQKKKWISTPEVFETLGYKWGNIAIITKSELDAISDYEDNLIRAIGDYKVYLVVNGIKHHIPNPEIFLDYGFGWSDVKDVPVNTIDKYISAKLIRESKQGKIYYLSSTGIKKWIPTAEIFSSYGNKWEDVQVISKKEMASYAVSNLMRYGGKIYLISGTYKKLIPSDAIFAKNKFNKELILDANKMEFDWFKIASNVK